MSFALVANGCEWIVGRAAGDALDGSHDRLSRQVNKSRLFGRGGIVAIRVRLS